jgi:hypothetical protein
MTTTILVTGNTYPVKDQIKALGGRWDAASKGWRVPADKAAAAQALVAGAPVQARSRSGSSYAKGRSFAIARVKAIRNGTADCHCRMCSTGNECLCIYQ